jgi:hypothetical protein
MSAALRQVAPVDDAVDLFEVKEWVLATFDLAIRQRRRPGDPPLRCVAECHGAAWLELFAMHERKPWLQRARSPQGELDRGRRGQLERLVALAPAAVDWVECHAGLEQRPPWDMFRRHLARRCDAIIVNRAVMVDEE